MPTSLAVVAAAALQFSLVDRDPAAVCGGIVALGLAFGGAATQLQTAGAEASGGGVDLAIAMVTTAWNAAVAASGFFGGVSLSRAGSASLPWAALALATGALLIVVASRQPAATRRPAGN